jgi:predicted small lipoprotein YifL
MSRLASTLLVVLLIAGCGTGGPTIAPVSGVVTLDGKPVEGAAVGFIAVGDGPVANGSTDAQGRYTLTCMNQSGAVVGDYKVVVSKMIDHGIRPDSTVAPGGSKIQWFTPPRYAKIETTGLTATVKSGTNDIPLELTSR